MKEIDHCLQRLFNAAAAAPRELPADVPFHLETRALAEWRLARASDHSAFVLPLLRRAFVCACVIVLVSGALSLRFHHDGAANELVIVDSVLKLTLMQ